MGMRPSVQSATGSVDKYLGTSYDDVAVVAENIEDVIKVADDIENIDIVAENIDNINDIAENIGLSLKYLGASETNPTQRLNGDPLEAGDYYLNTISDSFFYLDSDLITWVEFDTDAAITAAARAEQAEINAKASEDAALVSATNANNSEVAAKNSEDISSANADATADDVILTNADRLATQADAIATAADRVATGADRVATGNDASNTAADRVQTGLDRVQTGLDAAATQADALQTAADRVQTQADALQTAADRSAVENLYDTYDDRYLGSKASDPTVDNDGDPLQIGAVYFNNVTNSTRFYNGSTWEDPEATATQAALTATTKANEAATSATNAANSEGEAANSATSAAASATTATNKAAEATAEAVIATNAATAASTSATEAENQANIASTKADEAEASADAASISEGNALDSETSAALDADRAETAAEAIEAFQCAMTKSEFFALAEKRIRDNAGSGFAEWGKEATYYGQVNNGIDARADIASPNPANANSLTMGAGDLETTQAGISRTDCPVVQVNGFKLKFALTGVGTYNYGLNKISFPPAPDGTKTYDTATGNVVQHADSATAFAAEGATNKVILSRQDYVFLEVWHEKISDKGQVYPLGNVQYGTSDYDGISLSIRNDGYTRFGEWDNTTTGKYAVWDDLSFAEKDLFLSDPENNIYKDGDDLIQVRYRIRVIEGLGDDWESTHPQFDSKSMRYASDGKSYIQVRGADITSDFITGNSWGYQLENSPQSYLQGTGKGIWNIGTSASNADRAHDGLGFAVPIALVQRRNQGGYHPKYNPYGCAKLRYNSTNDWHSAAIAPYVNSTLDCMTPNTALGTIGYNRGTGGIGENSGRTNDGKFYDAIYASDVKDLRMSSRRRPKAEIRKEYKRKAIAGEIRGFEGVPFSRVYDDIGNGTHPDRARLWLATSGNAGFLIYCDTDVNGVEVGDKIFLYDNTDGFIVSGNVISISGSGDWFNIGNASETTIHLGSLPAGGSIGIGNTIHYIIEKAQSHSSANPTWTDIIGDPARILATFPDGVEGQWIPEIPDGTAGTWRFNRKVLGNPVKRLDSFDDGATWGLSNRTVNLTENNEAGQTGFTTLTRLYHYETQAHFTEDAVNSEVLDLGDVTFSSNYEVKYGALLQDSLIGKLPTDTNITNFPQSTPITRSLIAPSNGNMFANSSVRTQIHGATTLSAPANGSTNAVKTLDYLSEDNGVGYVNLAYKGMIYDTGENTVNITIVTNGDTVNILNGDKVLLKGFTVIPNTVWIRRTVDTGNRAIDDAYLSTTVEGSDGNLYVGSTMYWERATYGWGDDNQFQVASNQESFTDDNGNTGVRGTARFPTQYFIDRSD